MFNFLFPKKKLFTYVIFSFLLKLNKEYEGLNVKFGINQYSDISDSKFSESITNIEKKSNRYGSEKRKFKKPIGSLPSFIDWRTRKNTVGEVRNQGLNGCGWAYAAAGVVQSAYSFKTFDLIQPSEDEICNISSTKSLESGLEWMKTFGVPLENSKEKISICEITEISIDSATDLQRAVVQNGPVTVTFKVGTALRHYKSGVFNISDCENIGTFVSSSLANFQRMETLQIGWHASVLIGYGKEYGLEHWIVKNSWGKTFGDRGYFKFARGVNLCYFEANSAFSVQV
uniref:Pept_C1 domain-containing protein n=1 Tax=Caenorhabditis tropicalis TaxID=1561998 RepID=A0A1I7U6M5_9PELO